MNSYVKHRCPKNTLYPVENEIDIWMCECKLGFMYFPLDDSCYEAYKQGPCPSKNYLVLPVNETLPRCVENPCLEDGIVPYNGACYPLQTIGIPCNPNYRLQVDITTFQLMGMRMYPSGAGGITDDFATRNCPSGSHRSLKSEACIKVRHNWITSNWSKFIGFNHIFFYLICIYIYIYIYIYICVCVCVCVYFFSLYVINRYQTMESLKLIAKELHGLMTSLQHKWWNF